jgi:glyoxylase-like metal-dependent hydrolase (beta-lactamase superfamily II)
MAAITGALGVQLRVLDAGNGDCLVLSIPSRNTPLQTDVFIIDGGPGAAPTAGEDARPLPSTRTRVLRATRKAFEAIQKLKRKLWASVIPLPGQRRGRPLTRAELVTLKALETGQSQRQSIINFNSMVQDLLQNQLTGVILSHFDNDHWGGIYNLFARLLPNLTWQNPTAGVPRFIIGEDIEYRSDTVLNVLSRLNATNVPLTTAPRPTFRTENSKVVVTLTTLTNQQTAGQLVTFGPYYQAPRRDRNGNPIPVARLSSALDVWTWNQGRFTLSAGIKRGREEVDEPPDVDSSLPNRNSILTLYLAGNAGNDQSWPAGQNPPVSYPSILFTGDSSAQEVVSFDHPYVQEMVRVNEAHLASLPNANAVTSMYLTILKVPHHGSARNSFQQSHVDIQNERLFNDNDAEQLKTVEQLLRAFLVVVCVKGAAAIAQRANYPPLVQVRTTHRT